MVIMILLCNSIHFILNQLITIGNKLRVNDSVLVPEGEVKDICIILVNNEKIRERDIQVQILVLLRTITSGIYTYVQFYCLNNRLNFPYQEKVISI